MSDKSRMQGQHSPPAPFLLQREIPFSSLSLAANSGTWEAEKNQMPHRCPAFDKGAGGGRPGAARQTSRAPSHPERGSGCGGSRGKGCLGPHDACQAVREASRYHCSCSPPQNTDRPPAAGGAGGARLCPRRVTTENMTVWTYSPWAMFPFSGACAGAKNS